MVNGVGGCKTQEKPPRFEEKRLRLEQKWPHLEEKPLGVCKKVDHGQRIGGVQDPRRLTLVNGVGVSTTQE